MNERDLKEFKAIFSHTDFRFTLKDGAIVVEKPILHDYYGVPLYHEDIYYFINLDVSYSIIDHCIDRLFKYNLADCTLRFSTRESAERWIKENKSRKPIYTDPENGDEFFEGELSYWFDEEDFTIRESINSKDLKFKYCSPYSKCYNTRKKCELALMNFIAKKHNI